MNRELLKSIYKDTWLEDCIDFLEDEFFNPKKEIRFCGDLRYYDLRQRVISNTVTLSEQILVEKKYREKRMFLIPSNETEKIYLQETLSISRELERMLLRKMERRNIAVGDLDRARQYPIDEIIQFKHDFAKCLWHNEKTGSLHMIKDRNIAYCHGACGKAYDSIDAARKVWGLSFCEAVTKLNAI